MTNPNQNTALNPFRLVMANLRRDQPVKRHNLIPRFNLFTTLATSIVLMSFISQYASATLHTWKGYGGSQNLDDPGNWFDGIPYAGDDIQFNNTGGDCGGTGNKRAFNNYGSSYFGNIIAYGCSGGMEWAGNQTAIYKFENQDTLSFTATANLQNRTGPDIDLQINPVNGPIAVANVILYNNKSLFIYGANTLTVNGVISQSGGTSSMVAGANGNSTVILKSANTFSGTTYVINGTLRASINGALGSSAVTLGDTGGSAGAALNLDGGLTWNGQTTTVRSGSSGTKTIANTSGTGGTATYNNNLTLNDNATLYANSSGSVTLSGSTLDLQSHTLTVDGGGSSTISGTLQNSSGSGKLVKNGSGTATLSNTGNSYTGGTTINAGTLSISSDSNLGAVPGSLNTSSITFGAASGQGVNTVLAITADTTLNANRGITIGANGAKLDASSHTLTVSSPIVNGSGNNHLFILAAGNTTFSGNLSGTGDIVKQGAGTLTLNGANNTFGTTTANFYLDNGNVYGANNNAFGSTSGGNGAVTMGADASGNSGNTSLLLTSGGISVTNPINVRHYSTFNNTKTIGGNNTSSTATFYGNLTLNDSVSLTAASGGTVAFTGVIQQGTATGGQDVNGTPGISIAGGGAVTLSGNNTFSGGVTLSTGQLNINSTTALGATASTLTISGVSTLDNTHGSALTLANNNAQNWNADFTFTGSSDLNLGTGTATMNADRQVTVSGGNLTVGGALVGTFNLTKAGSGNLIFKAAATRSSGTKTTTINGGKIRIENATALNASGTPAAVIINSGGIFELATGITDNEPVTFNNGATLRSDGSNTEGGKITVSSAASASVTLATVSSSDTFTVGNGANNVSGGSGTSTIHIAGPGTNLLSQVSDYTGNWSVDTGTLLLQSSAADLGATSTATLTLNGGALKLNYSALQTFVAGAGNNVAVTANSTMTSDRTSAVNNGLTYTLGNLSINGSQLNIVGGANVTGGSNPAGITFGATTLSGSPIFNISNPTAGGSTLLTLGTVNNGANTGTLKGNGNFAQTGVWGSGAGGLTLDATYTGTATLNQVNTYTGSTAINGGTLQIGDGTTDGSITSSSSISDNAALIYNLVGSQTYANAISGTGTLTKSGGGSLTLSGNNSYNGTTVSGGTLRVNSQTGANSGTGSGTVAVNSGGTLSGNGRIAGNVTVASSASALLYPNSGSTLTFGGNLTVGSSSTVKFDLTSSASGANDKVVLESKTLTFGSSTPITINSAGTLSASDYVLFDAGSSGTISGTYNSVPVWTGTTPKYSTRYSLVTVGKTIVLRYTPIAITVTAAANTKTYDGTTTAAATPTVTSGTLDAADTGTWTETYTTNSAGIGNKTLTPSGTVAAAGPVDVTARYNITFTSISTGTINQKALTVSGSTAASTVYDGTTTAKLGGAAAFQGTEAAGAGNTTDGKPYSVDSVTPNGTAAGTLAAKDVGTQNVTITGITATGAGSGNYTVTQQTGLTQQVTQKALTVSGITAASTPYDGTTTAKLGGTAAFQAAEAAAVGTGGDGKPYTGNGDVIVIGGTAAGTLAAKDVGTQNVTITGVTVTGTGSGNYTVTQQTGLTQQVTQKALTVTGITANNKPYDTTTTATLNTGSAALSGNLDAGNVVLNTGSATGTFTPDGTVGTGKTVQVSGLTVSGSATNNYSLTQPTATADITNASTTMTLVSGLNPAGPGTNVIFTATLEVVAPGAGTPTGSVTFKDGGSTLGTGTLNGSGQAALTNNSLAHGTNSITAEYAGAGFYNGSTNSPALSQIINTPPVGQDITMGTITALPKTMKIIGGKHAPADADGDTLAITATTSGANGATVGNDGTNVTYTSANTFAGTDSFNYIVGDGYGGFATNTVTVIVATNGPGYNLLTSPVPTGSGTVVLTFAGIPGDPYALDWTTNLALPIVWVPVTTNTADTNGLVNFTNTSAVSPNYFRTRQP